MQPKETTAYVFADNDAPDIELLKKQAFFAIMELTEAERICVLSKYAERYGLNGFN